MNGHAVSPPRLILLGTAGGPRVFPHRAAPSQVVVAGGSPYLVDCGEGALRRLAQAGFAAHEVEHLFIGHLHSDHIADYGNLLLLSWASGRERPIEVWGPPPLGAMTDAFFAYASWDIATRTEDEGRPPIAPLVRVHEIDRDCVVMEDEHVKVTAVRVNHPPVHHTYAYRFDGADRSIVISNDTTPWDPLVQLASGADVLVHDAMHVERLGTVLARNPNATSLLEHLRASHTSITEVGKVARRAGVATLVLSHLTPADEGVVSETEWLDPPRRDFDGTVLLGHDLLEV